MSNLSLCSGEAKDCSQAGGLGGGVGVKGWAGGRLNRARPWLPKPGTLFIQTKDPIGAVAASQGDVSMSTEKQLL